MADCDIKALTGISSRREVLLSQAWLGRPPSRANLTDQLSFDEISRVAGMVARMTYAQTQREVA